jgi:hypothetical protein
MQDGRKEMPNAAVNVGDEAEWRARIVTALFGVTLYGVATDFAGAGLALIAKPVNARRER